MPVATVAERYKMQLPDEDGSGWYLGHALRQRKAISQSVTIGWYLYQEVRNHVPNPTSVLETFGGMGCQSLIIADVLHPPRHVIWENSPAAVAHLRSLPLDADVLLVDAYKACIPAHTSVVAMDFGDLTILSAQRTHAPLLEAVFDRNPRAVTITDVAGSRLHLHRERYSLLTGTSCDDYPSYLEGLANWLADTYGYEVTRCWYHRTAAKMVAVPRHDTRAKEATVIKPVPDTPVGLVIQ
jgi:hypothetical protein